MSYLIPREGDVSNLTDLLSAGEDWSICLYSSAKTPAETDTAASYTAIEADFTGYSRKTLTRTIGAGTWSTPTLQAPSGSPPWSGRTQVGTSSYGSAPQTWTCGATGNSIYGYFFLGVTSGTLILAEAFPSAKALSDGDSLAITPIFEFA